MWNKAISHINEVNWLKAWEVNKKLICTHTDSRDVYVWNLFSQENTEQKENIAANRPDLILKGHLDFACYALDWHKTQPIVASGGKDKRILLWNLENYFGGSGKHIQTFEDIGKVIFILHFD